MKKYKLIIKGGYGLTNFGDDALLYTLSYNIKPYFDSNDVAFACYKNEYNTQYTNGFEIIDVKEFKNINTKFLVYGGGTQFYNFKAPYTKSRVLLSKIKQFLLGNKKKIKIQDKKNYDLIGAIGVGLGPFINDTKQNKELSIKKEFERMSFVSVRDEFSSSKSQEWKLNNVKYEADICYSMENKLFFQKNINSNIKKIGIIVRDWDHTEEGKAYYERIVEVTKKLEKENYEVTLILFAVNSDNYWNNEKIKFKNILEWKPSEMTIESFVNDLNNFDLFITARYHGVVFATLLGKPFISIVVEQKLRLISDIYKSGSKKWKYPFEVNDCINKIKEIDQRYKQYSNNIINETLNQKKLSDRMFKRFIDFCNSNNLTKDS
jgi:polysaccharide pyruvyl transferase WcaK-like protein